jgi:hypothetical protein
MPRGPPGDRSAPCRLLSCKAAPLAGNNDPQGERFWQWEGGDIMADKLLVIVSTGEKNKALAGLVYAANALKQRWLSDVKVGFFGPAEALLAQDADVQRAAAELPQDASPFACKFIADKAGVTDRLTSLGINVHYVGETISGYVKNGYIPMVF